MAKLDTIIAGRRLSLHSSAGEMDMRRIAEAAAQRIEALRGEQKGQDALTLTTLALLNLLSEDEKLKEESLRLKQSESALENQRVALQARVAFLEDACLFLTQIQKETKEAKRVSSARKKPEGRGAGLGSAETEDSLLQRQQSFL